MRLRGMGRLAERSGPAVVAFFLTISVLAPGIHAVPQHGDEDHYIWSAAYFGGKLARFDFSPAGRDPLADPGWSPYSWWAQTQPMGARFAIAPFLGLSGVEAPSIPYLFAEPRGYVPETEASRETLLAARLAAVTCAAV